MFGHDDDHPHRCLENEPAASVARFRVHVASAVSKYCVIELYFIPIGCLQEIEAEIARRQADMNALNEQAEELTERDTPPLDQRLLQLNQKWVGIRSRVANFKPSDGLNNNDSPTTNGKTAMSPPTKQKYEYAVVNKDRKKQSATVVTEEVRIETTPNTSPRVEKSPITLQITSPMSETPPALPDKPRQRSRSSSSSSSSSDSSSSGSIDVDEGEITLNSSVSSKRSVIVTDLDEATKSLSEENLLGQSEDSLEEVRILVSKVGILQQQLRMSGIEIDQYSHENFSTSQDILKVSTFYRNNNRSKLYIKFKT